MPLTLGFLQARMGSTRLPGKILMRVRGKTILERAVERLRATRSLHGVAVLTTTRDEDEQVVYEDNPLLDIGSVDRIVRTLYDERLDYCTESNLPIGAATEAVTCAALKIADRLGNLPHHREHVTIYIKEHSGDFRTAFPDPPIELRRPDLRITVDTAADLAFVDGLIRTIPEGQAPIPLERYLALMPPAATRPVL
jgi:spore coat polysaccharide biosynthesis protein SpsF